MAAKQRILNVALIVLVAVGIAAVGLFAATTKMEASQDNGIAMERTTGAPGGVNGLAGIVGDPGTNGPKIFPHHRSVSWCVFWWWQDMNGCGVFSGHPVTCDWAARLVRLCR